MEPNNIWIWLIVALPFALLIGLVIWRSRYPKLSEAIRQDLAAKRPFKAVIYIASPYTIGDKQTNVDIQRRTAHTLLDLGYCPIAPLLSHYLEELRARPWEEWMQMDFELIRRSDALLRLPGESKGADMEVAFAQKLGKPVYPSINDILEDGYYSHEQNHAQQQ